MTHRIKCSVPEHLCVWLIRGCCVNTPNICDYQMKPRQKLTKRKLQQLVNTVMTKARGKGEGL